jgi:hypothetical protein
MPSAGAEKYSKSKYSKYEQSKAASDKSSVRGKRAETSKKKEKKEVEAKPGFLVTVEGYSPYKNIGELMDPAGVKDDKSKWGFITRLMYLNDVVDGNSPFELYDKTDIEQFKLEIGEVDPGSAIPKGIGVEQVKATGGAEAGDSILIDPMTKEVISKVAELDEYGRKKTDILGNPVYKVHDRWFRLNTKFVWKDAPKK